MSSPRVSSRPTSTPSSVSKVTLPSIPLLKFKAPIDHPLPPLSESSPPSVGIVERPEEPIKDTPSALKRTYLHFSLPSDKLEPSNEPIPTSPRKKVKGLLTSVSAESTDEVENLRAHRMLQIARASRDTFHARLRYNRLRLKELQMMCSLTTDECDEAEALTKKAEWQIGELKHVLNREGGGLKEHGVVSLFGTFAREMSGVDTDDDNDGVCLNSAVSSSDLISNYDDFETN